MTGAKSRQGYPTGVMVHSDQGSQYCSRDFRALLLTSNCIQSMSRRGNCWDNAVTENFSHTLKGHVIHDSVFATRKEVNAVLFDYIEIYYNRVRRHSANGCLSPEAVEQKYFKSLEGPTIHNTILDQTSVFERANTLIRFLLKVRMFQNWSYHYFKNMNLS